MFRATQARFTPQGAGGMVVRRRFPAVEVLPIALELLARILPATHRALIVGSLLRELSEVGDIEILAQPRTLPHLDLFEHPTGYVHNDLDELLEEMLTSGELERRQFPPRGGPRPGGPWLVTDSAYRWGPRYKAAIYKGIPVDLFSVLEPAQFGVLQLIRTGPADFSRCFVTQGRKGGILPNWAEVRNGGVYSRGEPCPIEMPEEEDAFRLLKIGLIPPRFRLNANSWPHLMQEG